MAALKVVTMATSSIAIDEILIKIIFPFPQTKWQPMGVHGVFVIISLTYYTIRVMVNYKQHHINEILGA